ncbi:ankyrin repeat-containing domain protein [Sporodiniella umbellata]|nr:ankyrin repeat-containing domain protein [Sporodiniella umbellata]
MSHNSPQPLRESLNLLLQRITDVELKEAIHRDMTRVFTDHDRTVSLLQERTEILEQECVQLQTVEENFQRRYEKAVREMQFFKKKHDEVSERLNQPRSPSFDSTHSSLDRESTAPVYHLPAPPMSHSETVKGRHLSQSSSSSTSSSATHWSYDFPPPPLPRVVQAESEKGVRKPSFSGDLPIKANGLHTSILQQRKVDPIAFGGSDALWDSMAKAKPTDRTLIKLIGNFLRRGGSPNTAKQSSSFKTVLYGYGMLHTAVVLKDLPSIELLIQHGANVNATSLGRSEQDKVTPLYLAASMGWLPGFQLLIEAGADLVLARGEGQKKKTALHIAAEHCHLPMVDSIFSLTPSHYHSQVDAEGANVLHYASASGHAALVAHLIQTYRVPLIANDRGETALHWASREGHLEVASFLIECCGCDYNASIPRQLNTPMDFAKAGNHKRLLAYYKKMGALTSKKMEKKREEDKQAKMPMHLESALSKNGLFGF